MNPQVRRLVSVAAAILIPLVLLIAFAASFMAWMDVETGIRQAEAERAVPLAADPARYLTPGDNRAVASSNLQTRLNQAARNAGLSTSRIQILPEQTGDPLEMTLEFQAEGDMAALTSLLHALEAELPALIVVSVRLAPIRNSENLQLTATVQARREPGSSS
jgi:Type II secretion system (T2SS), protein M subtype b